MSCPLCASGKEKEFSAEMIIHHSGLENLKRSPVLVFPKLLVCMDCGSSRVSIPRIKAESLGESAKQIQPEGNSRFLVHRDR
jgi:hypothetical protein